MNYSGRTLVRTVQHGTDWAKKISRNSIKNLGSMESIDALLAKPTWSVRSLLPPQQPKTTDISTSATDPQTADPPGSPAAEEEITPSKLHHLLRLSALPLPSTPAEESRLLADLRSQVHFVKHLQSVDTTGVQPLVSLRDETEAAREEQMIGLKELMPWLESENQVGKNGTVRRRKTDIAAAEKEKQERRAEEAEEKKWPGVDRFLWPDLEPSGREEARRWNGYYVVADLLARHEHSHLETARHHCYKLTGPNQSPVYEIGADRSSFTHVAQRPGASLQQGTGELASHETQTLEEPTLDVHGFHGSDSILAFAPIRCLRRQSDRCDPDDLPSASCKHKQKTRTELKSTALSSCHSTQRADYTAFNIPRSNQKQPSDFTLSAHDRVTKELYDQIN